MPRVCKYFLLVSAILLFVLPSFAQETLKVDITLVSVPVIVSDRQGRYVGGLQQQDFTLYEDGVKQEISFFAANEEPLTVALLLDTSQSTKDVLNDIRHAAKDFVKKLRPQDRAMIVSFDHEVTLLTDLTADHKKLEQGIESADIGIRLGTMMRDAVANVTEKYLKPIKGRKAIVLLTDGKDHGSSVSEEELLDLTEESDTMIYPIFYLTMPKNLVRNQVPKFPRGGGLGGIGMGRRGGIMLGPRFPRMPNPNQQAKRERRRQRVEQRNEGVMDFLDELAAAAAGRFYRSDTTDLKKTFGLITDELRHQYRIGFYPAEDKNEGNLHQLKVEVAKSDVVVRSRHTYRLATASQPVSH